MCIRESCKKIIEIYSTFNWLFQPRKNLYLIAQRLFLFHLSRRLFIIFRPSILRQTFNCLSCLDIIPSSRDTNPSVGPLETVAFLTEHFTNFRASKYFCSSETSIDGFRGSQIVQCSVGLHSCAHAKRIGADTIQSG